jgi:homotetrameric cytidine deaminase
MYIGKVDALASRLDLKKDEDPAMNIKLSPAEIEALLSDARKVAENSYSPYSGFRVGASLHLKSVQVVTGTNVENVSYGLTICAERAALVRAVSEFGPNLRIQAVAVANLNDAASPPCGACRQMLAEFMDPDGVVVFPSATGNRQMRFDEMLPLAFEMKPKHGNEA